MYKFNIKKHIQGIITKYNAERSIGGLSLQ